MKSQKLLNVYTAASEGLKVDQLVLCTFVAEEEPPVAAQTPLIQMAW